MFQKRTDLALEARELWQESAERTSRLSGVKATKTRQEGYPVTRVDILDHRGEEALGKPVGSDVAEGKTTFVTLLGLEVAKTRAAALTAEAEQILSQFPQHEFLLDLTRELLCREK